MECDVVLKSFCAGLVEEAPGFTALLAWPENEVLRRHCCEGSTFVEIAALLDMSPGEVEVLHDRASERLTVAVERLLADLELERLAADPASLLREMWRDECADTV
jgi:hypothetical protein